MLAFQVLGNHGYFFKRQAVAKAVFMWEMKGESNREQLKRNISRTRPGRGQRDGKVSKLRVTATTTASNLRWTT